MKKGFTTKNGLRNLSVQGVEATMRDVLNFIYTIPGELPAYSNIGTRIPLLNFEKLDEGLLQIIKADIEKAINYHTDLKLIDCYVAPIPDSHTVTCFVDVLFIGTNTKHSFQIGLDLKN